MPSKWLLTLLLLLLAVPFAAGPGVALADDDGAVKLLATVPIPDNLRPLRGFDISWVDAKSGLYFLADRSNASIDVVDARTNQFLRNITVSPPFAGVVFKPNPAGSGVVADNDRSGPNGVVVFGNFLFASDAGSRVVSIDLRDDHLIDTFFTAQNDPKRADEVAFDPRDGILMAVNNADDVPFATLIKVNKQTGEFISGQRVTFDKADSGFDATNGAEQPVWDPVTRRFYISIPEINCPDGDSRCGGAFPDGAVARINPHTAKVDALFPVKHCQPAGLTLGPRQDLLLGCSVVFDTAGNAWSASDPNSAKPISVIMDARDGSIDRRVRGVSGSDEVWFNPGDGRYYLAARNQPGGPVLGVIDAESQKLIQVVPTINTAGKTSDPPFPASTAHSVAVDPHNNHALVPLGANNVFPNCLNGCIAVFGSPRDDDDRHDRDNRHHDR